MSDATMTDFETVRKALDVRGTSHWKPTPLAALSRIERVVEAARQVERELAGLIRAAPDIADVIGNTNLAVLVGKLALLRAALGALDAE